jgi:hypothetical protein
MKVFSFIIFALACMSGACSLLAQERLYDLSNYKARYELRPGMRLNFSSDFGGNYAREQAAFQRGRLFSSTNWFMNRNTDERISFWSFDSWMRFSFGSPGSSPFNPGENQTNLAGRISINSRRDNYREPEKFWGWSTDSQVYHSRSSQDRSSRSSRLSFQGRLYRGKGRIEFAEDALLANWMLEDLQKAGVISNYEAEDVEALALTITDIIGYRVFDFRRRRIYELEQLQQTLLERGVTQEESFQLFAILNDNWAFANRAVLTHGNRFAYGIETSVAGMTRYQREDDFTDRDLDLGFGGFAEYTRSRIINNNGSASFTTGLQLVHYVGLSKVNSEDTTTDGQGWSGEVYLTYLRKWLPNSRTEFSWNNTLAVNHILQTNASVNSNSSLTGERLTSSLLTQYFINFQWSFAAGVGFDLQYERAPDQLRFMPNFSFRTNYFFF